MRGHFRSIKKTCCQVSLSSDAVCRKGTRVNFSRQQVERILDFIDNDNKVKVILYYTPYGSGIENTDGLKVRSKYIA